MKPTIGRIVLYTLSAEDCIQINRRRTTSASIGARIAKNTPDTSAWPLGAQAHIGNAVNEGHQYAMMVTGVCTPKILNGQVFLDGNDVFWARSVSEGEGPGSWCWPPRV
jgi:hypothetical protein